MRVKVKVRVKMRVEVRVEVRVRVRVRMRVRVRAGGLTAYEAPPATGRGDGADGAMHRSRQPQPERQRWMRKEGTVSGIWREGRQSVRGRSKKQSVRSKK